MRGFLLKESLNPAAHSREQALLPCPRSLNEEQVSLNPEWFESLTALMGREAQAMEGTATAMLGAPLLLPCGKEEDRVASTVGCHPNTTGPQSRHARGDSIQAEKSGG